MWPWIRIFLGCLQSFSSLCGCALRPDTRLHRASWTAPFWLPSFPAHETCLRQLIVDMPCSMVVCVCVCVCVRLLDLLDQFTGRV
jgi:hypothetical protein